MAKTKNGQGDTRIEYVALSTIQRWPQNPLANSGDLDEGAAVDPTDAILEKWASLGFTRAGLTPRLVAG